MTGTTTPATDGQRPVSARLASGQGLSAGSETDVDASSLTSPYTDSSSKSTRNDGAAIGNKGAAALTPEIQNRIGSQLQALYNDLLAESTPDRFLKLLKDLDGKS